MEISSLTDRQFREAKGIVFEWPLTKAISLNKSRGSGMLLKTPFWLSIFWSLEYQIQKGGSSSGFGTLTKNTQIKMRCKTHLVEWAIAMHGMYESLLEMYYF